MLLNNKFKIMLALAVFVLTGLFAVSVLNNGHARSSGNSIPILQEARVAEAAEEEPDKTDLVSVSRYIPEILIDMRYADSNNIHGQKIYDDDTAYLRKGTVDKLKKVQTELEDKGYCLLLWDAYRPPQAQFKLWEICPDARYIANPYKGYSNHSRGCAVDVTLLDSQGQELEMPSAFDDFSSRADRQYEDVSRTAANNAKILEDAMTRNGFVTITTEWWHFEDSDKNLYDVVEPPPASNAAVTSDTHGPPSDGRKEITISAIGDCTLGTDSSFPKAGRFDTTLSAVGNDYSYFFSRVRTVLENDDLTIANLETTLTAAQPKAIKDHQEKPFFFKGDPAYTEILKQGSIEAVNLANNHTHDYLLEGYQDTMHNLGEAEILFFGYDKKAIALVKDIRIGMLGYNVLGRLEEKADAGLAKQVIADIDYLKANSDLLIVSFHWGMEGSPTVTEEQKVLGRLAVDHGADMVLGHHPHVIQPIEKYKGKFIVYSLANFCFGGNNNPRDKDTFIYQQTFAFDHNNNKVGSSEAKIIPCSVSSVSNYNNFCPTIVEGEAAQRIMEKVGLPHE